MPVSTIKPINNDQLAKSRLSAAAAGMREAKAAVVFSREHLGFEIAEARRAGLSWETVTTATGLSMKLASDLKLAATAHLAPEKSSPADNPTDPSILLMSVQEYCSYAGISNMTVYKKVRNGQLESTRTERGKIRIVVRPAADDAAA